MGTADTPNGMRNNGARAWTLAELMACADLGPVASHLAETRITAITDDSRRVSPGSCFVAVRGAGLDGHDFIDAAVRAGAAAIIVEREVPSRGGATIVRVPDTRETLARLAATYFGVGSTNGHRPQGPAAHRRGLELIGVTGTNGKTTVTWLLRSIFEAAGQRTALFGTIEYDLIDRRVAAPLTTPSAIELCGHLAEAKHAGATTAVMEVSSHALDQRRTDGLAFAAGVFTNLTGDHLDYHGDMDAYFAAKRRLFEGLSQEAVAVINYDDGRARHLRETCLARTVTYSVGNRSADAYARILESDAHGTQFAMGLAESGRGPLTIAGQEGLCRAPADEAIRLKLPGLHNVSNALAAAVTSMALGIGWEAMRRGLEAVQTVPGRLQRIESPDRPFSVYVDYAHTDDALRNVLSALRPITPGRLLCVFGCGGNRDRSKRPRMAAVAERLADLVFVTSDNPRREDPRAIIEDIVAGFARPRSVRIQPDRRQAIAAAIAEARAGDAVLIAGKGHEDYQLVGDRVLPFDDASVAKEILQQLEVSKMKEAVA